MQNIDRNENSDTLNKFEDLQLTQPASLESLTSEQHKLLNEDSSKTESSRIVQSDPEETQAKAKTRSRFSSALRKLSRSTRKKEKPNIKLQSSTATESSEQIVSSGTEDISEASAILTDVDKKSKKKKKSGKSIFGLKKSKVVPKSEETKINFEESDPDTAKLLAPLFQDKENEVVVTTERLTPTSSRSKVQITIKSKKIEKVASQEQLNRNPSTSSPSLSPAPSPTPITKSNHTLEADKSKVSDTPTATTSSNEPLDKSKKLKTKVTTQTAHTTTTTTTTKAQSKSKQQQQQQQQQEQEEQITITQSSKDTPPKEKAPTKPSRLTTTTSTASTPTTTSQTSKSSGAVRKTAATTKAAIRLVTGAKSKQKNSSANITKGSTSTANSAAVTASTATTTTSTTTTTKKDTVLMINPQRGYRLPRPTSTTTTPTTSLTLTNTVQIPQIVATSSSSSSAAATTETQNIDHTTIISSLPATTTTTAATITTTTLSSPDSLTTNNRNLPQIKSSEIQSSSNNASLATSPPTPTVIATTIADNSSTNNEQQQQENIQTSPIDNSNSVHLTTYPQTDDHISLAESVKPDTVYDSVETIKEPLSVNFAVGSPVRAPIQKSLFGTPEPFYIDDKDPSLTEANRRRIQYISQPSLFDDLSTSHNKRLHYRYQSGVSDLSLDTDENEDTLNDFKQMPAFGDLTMDQEMEPSVMTSTNTEKREHLYKILVIGELGTGKTSFIKRYVHQFFSQNYRATIGVDFALKVLHWDPNTIVRLQLWDIAGQERFGNMTRVYYKEAVGAFIVFDVTRSGTFDCVSKWKEDLDSKVQLPDGSPIPCILLANKCDQDKQGVVTNAEKMDEYVKEHNFAGWFETSAKENINIDEAARALVNKILLNDKLISAADLADSEKFNLNNTGDQTALDGKNKCSC
ncbi:RAS oncogene family member Rab32 [Cochliomyia hominivorax]